MNQSAWRNFLQILSSTTRGDYLVQSSSHGGLVPTIVVDFRLLLNNRMRAHHAIEKGKGVAPHVFISRVACGLTGATQRGNHGRAAIAAWLSGCRKMHAFGWELSLLKKPCNNLHLRM